MKVKSVRQGALSAECWNIQVWGTFHCKTCEYNGKRDCGGKKIQRTGKNENGFKIGPGGIEVEGKF